MTSKFYKASSGPKKFLLFLLFGATAMLLLGGIVMLLWNAILPSLLHVGVISFWQSIGLLLLCKILFSSFRPGGRRHSFGPPGATKEKLMNMSEEEKTIFREQWKKRCAARKE